MDSLSSSTNTSSFPRFKHSQPISDRILRALRHRLLLLHRSDSSFFILGATGNVYTVTLSSFPSCSCPDRTSPCKHILFVFIRVLGVSLDDVSLRRRSLRPCHLRRLLTTPTSPDSVAGAALRERFHQLFFTQRQGSGSGSGTSSASSIEVEDGSTCPICLEEMGKEDMVVACATCRNPIHEDCLDDIHNMPQTVTAGDRDGGGSPCSA
ncbi:mitogen-activated protein kinase kinase kinase 1 [Senna tora]|uniref:Mitogen-activated protein kinase kinase kinase 1 n=1 Tax=Senna tora TaxID=362788 RepID=A0A834WF71_9FABA|nr:mitogen-activated protein kinase kinase kinase 1 [Senna tora]